MTMRAFQIFAAGTQVDASGTRFVFSNTDLDRIALSYDPAKKTAPLVLGHPSDEDTVVYGRVRGVIAYDAALFCVADVQPSLLELVRAGRYGKVSASFYVTGGRGNPLPEGYYLRHVGFLGANPPAVKGMQPLAFAAPKIDDADSADFAEAYGNPECRSAQIHRVALDLQRARPGIGLVDAAIRAERATR